MARDPSQAVPGDPDRRLLTASSRLSLPAGPLDSRKDLRASSAQMSFLRRLSQPLRGSRLLRRLLVELRGIRRAQERQADAAELAAGLRDRSTVGGQVFRSFAQTKADLAEPEMHALTEVSYVSDRDMATLLAKEEELRSILGRDPSPEQVLAAVDGQEP